uniref:WD_REPEATS_REGION domain-containing protein n=1 Tax=Rhabditophanes sp. KR3021 TaxID=114890 RepID=A0AC35TMX8_9BILA
MEAESSIPRYKSSLFNLFAAIEKEFDFLYTENIELREKLENISGDKSVSIKPSNYAVKHQIPPLFNISKKGPSQMGQKLKTAFKVGQPGLFSNSLKDTDNNKVRYTQTIKGHEDGIWDCSSMYVPSLSVNIIGSASADRTSILWYSESGSPFAKYTGHAGSVNSINFKENNPNSEIITALTTSGDKTAHIWQAKIAKASESDEGENNYDNRVEHVVKPLIKLEGHSNTVVSAVWFPNNDQIITASWDRTANIYDVNTGVIVNSLSGHEEELNYCNVHKTHSLIITASKDSTFRLWDIRDTIRNVSVVMAHNDSVTSVTFTSDDKIISASEDKTVKIFDTRNLKHALHDLRLESPVNKISYCESAKIIAMPMDCRHIKLFDIAKRRTTQLPRINGKCHRRIVCSASWILTGLHTNLVTCGWDKKLIGWKVQI